MRVGSLTFAACSCCLAIELIRIARERRRDSGNEEYSEL